MLGLTDVINDNKRTSKTSERRETCIRAGLVLYTALHRPSSRRCINSNRAPGCSSRQQHVASVNPFWIHRLSCMQNVSAVTASAPQQSRWSFLISQSSYFFRNKATYRFPVSPSPPMRLKSRLHINPRNLQSPLYPPYSPNSLYTRRPSARSRHTPFSPSSLHQAFSFLSRAPECVKALVRVANERQAHLGLVLVAGLGRLRPQRG